MEPLIYAEVLDMTDVTGDAADAAAAAHCRTVKGKIAQGMIKMMPTSTAAYAAAGCRELRAASTKARFRSCYEATRLDALEGGFIFAARYKIERDQDENKPHGRLALDLSTGQRVFLKFYPRTGREFQNAVRMHKTLQTNGRVCKLLDTLPNKDGFPPCLVLEAGSFTMAQRLGGRRPSSLEQQALVHSVLEAVAEMHSQSVVHGNLDPTHVMWFSTDFTWKIVNLDTASKMGDPVALENITSRRYTAPEIRLAVEKKFKQIHLDYGSDMWAVGLIAFEVFAGASVFDASRVQSYVTRELDKLRRHGAIRSLEDFETQRSFKTPEECVRDLQLVEALLRKNPTKRATALQALRAEEMQPVQPEADNPIEMLENFFAGRGPLEMGDDPLEKWLVGYMACEHLNVSVSAERFAMDSDDAIANFYERDTQKTKRFCDDCLPQHPVHVLTAGEIFRLRISIQRDEQLRFPLEEIVSVHAQPPDGESIPLEVWQRKEERKLTALALIDPSEFNSKRLNAVCPIFGLVDTKYVRLTVRVKLRLGDGFPDELPFCHDVYLQLKRPPMKLHFFKGLTKYTKWDAKP